MQPSSAGRQIDLGSTSDSGDSLGLSNAELNRISAGVLQIGGGNSGSISITQAIAPANVHTLALQSGGAISQTASLAVDLLAVEAGGSVSLEDADNNVNTLAIQAAFGDIAFADRNGFNVNTVNALQTLHGISASGGDVRLTAHNGHINVLNTPATADVSAGGSIVITLAGGGTGFTTIGTSHMQAGKNVSVSADKITLIGTIAAPDSVTLQPHSAGWLINVGSASDASANTLGISVAELAQITAGVLRIGASHAGAITVSSTINPAGVGTLHLMSGGSVSQSAPIQVTNLAVSAGGSVPLNHLSNDVDVVAIRTTAGDVFFRDADGFTVGSLADVHGVGTSAGGVTLAAMAGDISVSNTPAAVDVQATTNSNLAITLNGPGAKLTLAEGSHLSGGIVQLFADRMNLGGTVEGLFGYDRLVQLRARNSGWQIDLGSSGDTANALELSDAELDRISAGVLQIGAGHNGSIDISQAIHPANVRALHLISGGGITQHAEGSVAVSQLALEAVGSVSLDGYDVGQRFNQVTTLAGKATGAGSGFFFTNKGGFSIGRVAGIVGVSANGGGIALIAHSPLTIDAAVTETGGGNIQLVASNDGSGEDHLTINASVQTIGGSGSIELVAGDDLVIQGDDTTVISASGGTITTIAGGSTTLDGDVQLIAAQPVRFNTADVIIHGTPLDDTIRVVKGAKHGEIEVIVNGASRGIYQPTGRIVVYGGDGNDDIEVEASITIAAWLYGGNGNDRLKGGAGHNVLIGGDGDDHLIGGRGRNLMIGGNGADRLVGGAGDDILIAGSTAYDHNLVALDYIMREWTRMDRNYHQRIANLRDGGKDGLNGEYRLVSADSSSDAEQWTVFDDEDDSRDILTGTAGNDWFFCREGEDKVTDLGRLERLDEISANDQWSE